RQGFHVQIFQLSDLKNTTCPLSFLNEPREQSPLLLRWQRAGFFVYFFLVKKSKVFKVLIFQVVIFPLDLAIARMVLAVGRPFSLCTLVSQYRKGYFDKVTNLFIYL